MGIVGNTIRAAFTIIFIFISFNILHAEDYTLADVSAIQDEASDDVNSMSAVIDTETEVNGKTQSLSYEYQMKREDNGSVKTMITTLGTFTMQFLVDTSDMSVTYLMAGGATKKFKLTEEETAQIQQMAGLGGITGSGSIRDYYAQSMKKSGTISDAGYGMDLNRKEIETDSAKVAVNRQKSTKKHAVIEFENKNAGMMRAKWDASIAVIEGSKPKNKGAENIKQRSIDKYKDKKEKVMKYMPAKRIQKINMRTGRVDEQEIYNDNGEKIGWFKSKKSKKIRVQGAGKNRDKEKVIELPDESEGEMEAAEGKSKFRTKYKEVKVNEPVEFKWLDVKKMRGGK